MGKQSVYHNTGSFIYRDSFAGHIYGEIYQIYFFFGNNGYYTISHYLSSGGIRTDLINIYCIGGE
jgi:hypothetical protein